MTTANCAICQDSLPSNPFSRWMHTHTPPCHHELHWDCAQQQVDYISATEPTQETLSCAVCRKEHPIPMQPSARKIARWTTIALIIVTWAPACIAAGFFLAASRPDSKRFILSVLFSISFLVGAFKRHSIQKKLLRNLTRLYNWQHGTEIHHAIPLLYLRGAMDRPPEEQGRYAINYAVDGCLEVVEKEIRPLFDEEEQELLKPLNNTLLSLRRQFPYVYFMTRTTMAYEDSAVAYLQTHAPELVARASRIGVHIMETQYHTALAKDLGAHLFQWLPSYLSDTPADRPFSDPLPALRIALIQAINLHQWQQNAQVASLFATITQEARTPNNTLLPLLQTQLPHHDFTQISKSRLLTDGHLIQDLFQALVKLKHPELSAQGFVMPSHRADSTSGSDDGL